MHLLLEPFFPRVTPPFTPHFTCSLANSLLPSCCCSFCWPTLLNKAQSGRINLHNCKRLFHGKASQPGWLAGLLLLLFAIVWWAQSMTKLRATRPNVTMLLHARLVWCGHHHQLFNLHLFMQALLSFPTGVCWCCCYYYYSLVGVDKEVQWNTGKRITLGTQILIQLTVRSI